MDEGGGDHDHARKPHPKRKKKRPRTIIRIADIKNDPIVEEDDNQGYITSDDEAPPEPGVNRISWDDFLRLAPPEKEAGQQKEEETTQAEEEQEKKPPPDSRKRKMTFDRGIRQLKRFKRKHGNLDVPKGYGRDPTFEAWLDQLRSKFQKKSRGKPTKLTDRQYSKLQKLGFQVSESKQQNSEFEKRLVQLKKFKRQFNHVKVPRGYTDIRGLRPWIIRTRNQLREKEKGNPSDLTDEQVIALNEVGFFWNNKKRGKRDGESKERKTKKSGGSTITHRGLDAKNDDSQDQQQQSTTDDFAQRLADLQAFKVAFKSTHVPEEYEGSPGLRDWTMEVRKQYWEMVGGCPSGLSDGQIYELNELGFDWDEEEEEPTRDNETKHNADQEMVSLQKEPSTPVRSNSKSAKESSLAQERETTTSQVGEELSAPQMGTSNTQHEEESFADRVSRLKSLQRQQSPINLKTTGLETSSTTQSEPRYQPLESRRLASDTADDMSMQSTITLAVTSQRKNGNEDVGDAGEDDNIPWGTATISKKQAASFKIHINSWLARMKKLEQYKATHGHMNVPQTYPDDQQFADWVHEQKRDFKKRWKGDLAALSDERFDALQKLGFVVAPAKLAPIPFDERVSQLKTFFKAHGHVKVPKKHADAPGLRKWLSIMRSEFKVLEQGGDANLSFGEIEVLNSLDFQWRGKRKPREKKDAQRNASTTNSHNMNGSTQPSSRSGTVDANFLKPSKHTAKTKDNHHDFHKDYSHINGVTGASFDPSHALDKRDRPRDENVAPASTMHPPKNWEKQQNGRQYVSKTHGTAAANISFKGAPTNTNGSSAASLSSSTNTPRAANVNKQDTSWGGRLQQLEEYKSMHGDVEVPTVYETDQAFANWVRTQRRLFSKRVGGLTDALSDERFNLLKNIGFGSSSSKPAAKPISSKPAAKGREIGFGSSSNKPAAKSASHSSNSSSKPAAKAGRVSFASHLEQFQPPRKTAAKDNTHHNPPKPTPKTNGSTAATSAFSITVKEEPAPSPAAAGQQQPITKHDMVWVGRLKQLEEYHALNGNTRVPNVYETDQAFANWVKTQRRLFSSRIRGITDAISDDRFFALQKLGFEPRIQ